MSEATKTAGPKTTTPTDSPRGNRRVVSGIVTGDKNSMTRRVEIQTLVKHPKYGKYIKQRTVCYAHDEKNESALGDTVEIMECRPLSKTKRWRLVRITKKAPGRTLSNLEGSVAGSNVPTATGKS
jgi:small subunit ribosomal protein S17